MKAIKRLTTFLFACVIVLVLIPITNAQAAITDIKIISETEVTAKQAEQWAKSNGATDTFVGLAQLYWKYASEHGNVNPAIAFIQAAKETKYGNFGGVLNESYNNPCGMKTSVGGSDSDLDAHQKFNTWDEGVQAHLDHLALYAGATGYPRSNTYDPRHFVTIKGIAVTVNALSGKWAPSLTYGEEINKLYNNLLVSSGSNTTTDKPQTTTIGSSGVQVTEPIQKTADNSTNISASIGWKLEGGNWYYYISNGVKATGWIKPDNNWYYLYSDGTMAKGWINLGGKWYYLKSSGEMQLGWLKDNNKWYYLQGDGSMTTGLKLIDGRKYFLDSSGAMRIGWESISGQWYYFSTSGNMLTGWINPDGNWYYLYSNGIMATGWLKLDGNWYYLKSSGAMATGWINPDGNWYYLYSNGIMATSWLKLDGNWYYLKSSGAMATGWINPDGNWYYLYSNGIMETGWLKLDGNWYYLKSSGARATGWIVDGSNSYYLQPGTGIMVKGTVIDGWEIGTDGKRGNKVTDSTSGKVIVIDPGHNFGGDDGAYATHNGITYVERDLNMQVADKLKAKLEAKGYTVIMTRNATDRETTSATQSLTNRVNIANNAGADLFISLHHNAATASARGVEVYYSSKAQDASFGGAYSDSKLSASMNIASSIASSITNSTGAINRGAKDGNLFVCRNTTMTSVLIEFGFITNPDEAQKCANSYYQDLEADAVAKAIAAAI